MTKADKRNRHDLHKARQIERRKARANKRQARAIFGGLA